MLITVMLLGRELTLAQQIFQTIVLMASSCRSATSWTR